MRPVGGADGEDGAALGVEAHCGGADSVGGELVVPEAVARCPLGGAGAEDCEAFRGAVAVSRDRQAVA